MQSIEANKSSLLMLGIMQVLTAVAVHLQPTKRFAFYFFLSKEKSSETEGILRSRERDKHKHRKLSKVKRKEIMIMENLF
jgi:hypothetical protein